MRGAISHNVLVSRYTLVARKGESAPLYWGADNADGESLIISTVPAYLSPFPPGCAFEVHFLIFSQSRDLSSVSTL